MKSDDGPTKLPETGMLNLRNSQLAIKDIDTVEPSQNKNTCFETFSEGVKIITQLPSEQNDMKSRKSSSNWKSASVNYFDESNYWPNDTWAYQWSLHWFDMCIFYGYT